MDNIYLVVKYGGEYEDKWEIPVAAFSSKEYAEDFMKKCKDETLSKISNKEWNELLEKVNDYETEKWKENPNFSGFDFYTDGIMEMKDKGLLDINYSEEELQRAENLYLSYDDPDFMISEIKFIK